MIETRPNLRKLSECQRILALAHWYIWLAMQHLGLVNEVKGEALRDLERDMQPETLHRLALARGSYFRELDTATRLTDRAS